jgi:phage terminase large subunit
MAISDEALSWYYNLAQTSNKAFMPLYGCKSRYLVLMGGAGSGKSIFAGRKIIERCIDYPHRILVARKVGRTLRESCFAQIVGQITKHYDLSQWRINKSDMVITYTGTGAQIIFVGLDDAEKHKSIYNITSIWIEEASEITEADFDQLDMRLRDETECYKQIILSFNPIDINHWLKHKFFDRKSEDVTTSRTTYKDNRFLPRESAAVLEAYKDTDPYLYTVYCLGEWGVYGKTIFDKAKIADRRQRIPEPVKSGLFSYADDGLKLSEIKFIEETGGDIRIYRQPEPYKPYVLGADTAGEGSDYFAAHVLDNTTGEQVAVLHGQYDEDIFTRQIYCLADHYNGALVGIEANFSTYPIKELTRLGYLRQYIREREDTLTGKIVPSYGFKTTSITRPVILSGLVEIVRDHIDLINDRATLEELLTFVRNEKGRAEAASGAHDDLVMSLAIAHYIRSQQPAYIEPPAPEKHFNFEFEKPAPSPLGEGEEVIVI